MAVRYLARASAEPRNHAVPTPEADDAVHAAILFAERHPAVSDDGQIRVTVVDCETGAEQCFRIDIDEGSAEPC